MNILKLRSSIGVSSLENFLSVSGLLHEKFHFVVWSLKYTVTSPQSLTDPYWRAKLG